MERTGSPYRGLVPYREEDAPFFFGRELERDLVSANLMASRLTLLYGPSGVGKTSLLHAGVVHDLRGALRRNLAERGAPELAVAVFSSWRDDPVEGLARSITDAAAEAAGRTTDEPSLRPARLDQTIEASAHHVGGELLVVLDQFEEYFLYHDGSHDGSQRQGGEGSFARELSRAINRPDLRVSFLISIRDDALARLDAFKGLVPNLFDNYLRIEHLDLEAARMAIEGPVEQYNRQVDERSSRITIERGLVDAVLEQVQTAQVERVLTGSGTTRAAADIRVETPYLQLVMARLWDEEAAAGSHRLQLATLKRLGGAERIVRTHLDDAMANLSPGEQDGAAKVFRYLVTPSGSKIAHTPEDLADYTGVPVADIAPVLEKLSRWETRILRPVASGPGQPDATRYEIFHDVLAPATLDWRLRHLQRRELERVERAARRRRRRIVRFGIALAGVLVLAAVAIVLRQRQQAGALIATAKTQARVAARAADAAVSFGELGAGAGRVRVAFSPNGFQLATGAGDGSVQLWPVLSNVPQRTPRRLGTHSGPVTSVAFSPDGLTVASGSADGIRLWAVEEPRGTSSTPAGPKEQGALRSLATVTSLAYSPDPSSPILVAGTKDGTIQLWNLENRELETLLPVAGPVADVALSPDGSLLASANGSTVELSSLQDPPRPGRSLAATAPTTSVAFTPDGQTLVSASEDGTVRLWDVATGKQLGKLLSGHTGAVNAVVVSPDGHTLATGGQDRTVRLWDIPSLVPVRQPFRDVVGPVASVAFSPNGRLLAVGGHDGVAKLLVVGQP